MGGVGYIDAIVGKVLTHAPEISAEPNEQQYAVCNDFGVIRRVDNEKREIGISVIVTNCIFN